MSNSDDRGIVDIGAARRDRDARLSGIRADLVTARETISRAVDGHDDVDTATALQRITSALEKGLPHASSLDTGALSRYFLALSNAARGLRHTHADLFDLEADHDTPTAPPDLPAAAAHLDTALRTLCTHARADWYTAPDHRGRILTTCHKCGVSWYEHELQQDLNDLPF